MDLKHGAAASYSEVFLLTRQQSYLKVVSARMVVKEFISSPSFSVRWRLLASLRILPKHQLLTNSYIKRNLDKLSSIRMPIQATSPNRKEFSQPFSVWELGWHVFSLGTQCSCMYCWRWPPIWFSLSACAQWNAIRLFDMDAVFIESKSARKSYSSQQSQRGCCRHESSAAETPYSQKWFRRRPRGQSASSARRPWNCHELRGGLHWLEARTPAMEILVK